MPELISPHVAIAPTPPVIFPEVFRQLVNTRTSALLSVASFVSANSASLTVTRPLLGELLSHSAQLEEFLDAYGARCNEEWRPFRQTVAVCKHFSESGYKLLHLSHSYYSYRLFPVDGDFLAATDKALAFNRDVLIRVSDKLLKTAVNMGLSIPKTLDHPEKYRESLPPGKLPSDRRCRRVSSAKPMVLKVATSFLNLAAESALLYAPEKVGRNKVHTLFPDEISEEKLLSLQQKFHTLQSLYDTFVSDTDIESVDPYLPILRGHISVIYHLLEIATSLSHFFERHFLTAGTDTLCIDKPLFDCGDLLDNLLNYTIRFSALYLSAAKNLSQEMIRRYTEISSISVPIPKYRGFHVRPSTLIARIVMHYGSDLTMRLGDERYDASFPLELFRANEKINAEKRHFLQHIIVNMDKSITSVIEKNMFTAVGQILASLASLGKVVIYERPLPLEDVKPKEGETLAQFAVEEISRLMAMGKIDIEYDINVEFIGDNRLLTDIQLLAESGYGEDAFGNNIALPKELEYLRRGV
jgi:hypothetical protein